MKAGARNLQVFHLVRYLVQETCKITGARNVHDSWLARSVVQEMCKTVQDFLHGMYVKNGSKNKSGVNLK